MLVVILLISGIGSGVIAYYAWPRVTIPFEVKEPIEILNYTPELSFFPGETKEINVTVQNHAPLNYSVILDFHLSDLIYQATYVTFSDEIYTIMPGQQNLTAWIKVKSSAPAVTAALTIDVKRVEDMYPPPPMSGIIVLTEWFDTLGWATVAATIDPPGQLKVVSRVLTWGGAVYHGEVYKFLSLPPQMTVETRGIQDSGGPTSHLLIEVYHNNGYYAWYIKEDRIITTGGINFTESTPHGTWNIWRVTVDDTLNISTLYKNGQKIGETHGGTHADHGVFAQRVMSAVKDEALAHYDYTIIATGIIPP